MAKQLDNRPFNYKIDYNTAVRSPGSLPLIAVRQIHSIMISDSTGTLEQRFIKAFKITISSLAERNLIRIIDGTVVLVDEGMRRELEAKTKQDSVEKNVRFNQWMGTIAQEQDRLAGK